MSPERGDIVGVTWLDTQESSVGNADNATLARRKSYGVFWEIKKDHNIDVLVTTTTIDEDGPEQQGWCIYPASNIESLEVIHRKRRRKPKASATLPQVIHSNSTA